MKIGIAGAFSTGKTTLAKQFPNAIVDVERSVIADLGIDLSKATTKQLVNFQKVLLVDQLAEEESMKSFITDNPIYTSLAYSLQIPDPKLHEWMRKKMVYANYDIVFFTPIEFEIVDDGLRHSDREFQKKIQSELLAILHHYQVPFVPLVGSVENRIQTMKKYF